MNLEKSQQFLREILPQVSRTFALNIRVLKGVEYDFVGTTYLICRFIDSIEDSPVLRSQEKVYLLRKFTVIFNPPMSGPESFSDLIKGCQNISFHKSENDLINRFGEIILLYNSFQGIYHRISKDMIIEMASGMAGFIEKYSGQKRKILNDEKELESYCYYVAGTVGVILTRLFTLKISTPKNREILEKYTNDFALALQMTNIVKDFNADKQRGWAYIPKTVLKQSRVTVEEFYAGLNSEQIKSIQEILIEKIEIFIENSIEYCLSIPVYLYKYRLFCLIPIFLSIKTVFFIKKGKSHQIHKRKINKKNLFITILIIYMIFPFNFLIKKYYLLIKKP